MSLIKCSECNKDVSTLAKTCPHCGAPVSIDEKNNDSITDKELQKVSVLKEKCSIFTTLLVLLLSFCMLIAFVLFEIDGYYLLENRTVKYELVRALFENELMYLVFISYGIIGIITLLSFFFTIISKKTVLLAKIGYTTNIAIQLIFFFLANEERLRVGSQFYLIFAINILLFLIPRLDKLKSEEILVNKTSKLKIEKKNKKIEKIYSKKRFSIIKIISIIAVLLFTLATILIVYDKNFEKTKNYKEKNPRDLPQLIITNEYITVREEPDVYSEKIGLVYEGDIYNIRDIIEDEDSSFIWYQIKYDGEKAYIGSDKENPYIKMYEKKKPDYLTDFGRPNTKVEGSIQKELAKRNYIHSDNGLYLQYYNDDDMNAEIMTTFDLNNNIFSRIGTIDGYYSKVEYHYDEKYVLFEYAYETFEGTFEYYLNTEDILSCTSNLKTYCSTTAQDDVDRFIEPVIEEFNEILEDANLKITDLY